MYITLYPLGEPEFRTPQFTWETKKDQTFINVPSVFSLLDELEKVPFFNQFEKVLGTDTPLNPWVCKKDRRGDMVFSLEFEIPRFRKEDIKLTAENQILHLSCEQNDLKLYKSVSIPDDLDVSTLTSELDHGILYLRAKQLESAKPFQIEITDGEKKVLDSSQNL